MALRGLLTGRRKDVLASAIHEIESNLYRGRILPFDQAAAVIYGDLVAKRERQGRRMEQIDAMIAAIALFHGATVATRDIDDLPILGLS
jgi:toxin FitB